MNKARLILAVLLSVIVGISAEAQSKKKNNKKNKAQTQITNNKPAQETVNNKAIPSYKRLSDPELVKYVTGGFTKDDKLFLITSPEYHSLNNEQKKNILSQVSREFPKHDILVYDDNQQRELWVPYDQNLCLIDQWDNDSLNIEHFMPLELNRNGKTKVFYQIGGGLSGSRGSHTGNLNFRCGSYLYQNKWDASASISLGYTKGGSSQFNGNIGVDSRYYFPITIKGQNLSPYAGAGASWAFSPTSYFELRLLTGACWFIGNGSLDTGFQYGTKSGLSFTIGYTFRPNFKL